MCSISRSDSVEHKKPHAKAILANLIFPVHPPTTSLSTLTLPLFLAQHVNRMVTRRTSQCLTRSCGACCPTLSTTSMCRCQSDRHQSRHRRSRSGVAVFPFGSNNRISYTAVIGTSLFKATRCAGASRGNFDFDDRSRRRSAYVERADFDGRSGRFSYVGIAHFNRNRSNFDSYGKSRRRSAYVNSADFDGRNGLFSYVSIAHCDFDGRFRRRSAYVDHTDLDDGSRRFFFNQAISGRTTPPLSVP